MKPHSIFLLAAALAVTACSPKRLSPVVLKDPAPAPAKSAPAKPVASRSGTGASSSRTHTAHSSHGYHSSSKSSGRSVGVSARAKADTAARLAERKRRLAAARRAQARKLAQASYEAGRQLLRENQPEPALRAFRESVRLNSHSPDAWMGVAYICEITGNTKDAVQAFREAKKLWGM
jgi:Flp pilus assembly protein TadD